MSFHLPANWRWICFSLLIILIQSRVNASDQTSAARQLIQVNGLDNILRVDAEQAGLIAARLPEDFPTELRSALRQAIDANLDYDTMERSLVATVSSRVDAATLDLFSRWWASSSGREIAKAESSAYASLFSDSTFQTYNPTVEPAGASNVRLVEEVVAAGKFPEFVTDLLQSTTQSRICLLSNPGSSSAPDCAGINAKGEQLTAGIASLVAEKYLRVSTGDLNAYLTFLRSNKTLPTLAILRSAEVDIEERSWQGALRQASSAVDVYAKAHFGQGYDAALRDIVTDIDNGSNLSRARFNLELMNRLPPPSPAVLVQLARVTLKLAQDLTEFDNAPSVPRLDEKSLEVAQRYIDQSLSLDANRPETLMIAGHIAYLQRRFPQSIQLEEKAQAAGGVSFWIHMNLGDALWASAMDPPRGNRVLIQRAADEFEAALSSSLPRAAVNRAVHQLGGIYAELGDIAKADDYHRRYVSMETGIGKAFALHRYANFLLFYAKDDDRALAAVRQAVEIYDFPVGRAFLVEMLAIKGGKLVSAGHSKEAAPFLNEARQMEPDLESICPDLARLPALFPGVIGIHASGAVKDFSGRIGSQTLVYVSMFGTAQQLEQLLSWGANPNYLDPEEGTALHRAILANNLDAVKTLLAHGANPLTPFIDGRLPTELNNDPSDVRRGEILALLRKAAGEHAVTPPGAPFRVGYEYRVKKSMDGMINGASWGHSFNVGDRLVYNRECRFTDSSVACFIFKKLSGNGTPRTLAIGKDQLVSWMDWFEEIGPERSAPNGK